jgi:hypothetical protein
VVQLLRGEDWQKVFRLLGHVLEGDLGTLFSSSLSLPCHEVNGFTLPVTSAIVCSSSIGQLIMDRDLCNHEPKSKIFLLLSRLHQVFVIVTDSRLR